MLSSVFHQELHRQPRVHLLLSSRLKLWPIRFRTQVSHTSGRRKQANHLPPKWTSTFCRNHWGLCSMYINSASRNTLPRELSKYSDSHTAVSYAPLTCTCRVQPATFLRAALNSISLRKSPLQVTVKWLCDAVLLGSTKDIPLHSPVFRPPKRPYGSCTLMYLLWSS